MAALLCLARHQILLATVSALVLVGSCVRLGTLSEARLTARERQYRKAKMEAGLASGPTGLLLELLGPKGLRLVWWIGMAIIVGHLIYWICTGN